MEPRNIKRQSEQEKLANLYKNKEPKRMEHKR